MDTDDIITELTELTPSERAKVRAALEILDRSKPGNSPETFWRELVQEAGERGIHLMPSIRRLRGYGHFATHAESAVAFLEKAVRPNDRTELIQAIRLGARALVSRLIMLRNEIGLEVTTRVAMGQVQNLPAAVMAQWPGGGEEMRFLLQRGDQNA